MPLTCHALECSIEVSTSLLMCPGHWARVPTPLRQAVLAAYHPTQQRTKVSTWAYRQAAARAIIAVAASEGIPVPPIWQRVAAGEES